MASSRSVNRYDDMDPPKPRNDAYTGLLTISFIAMFIGCLLLFIDFYSFEGMAPAKLKDKLTQIKGVERAKGAGAEKPAPPPPEPKEVNKKDEKAPEPQEMKKDEKAPEPKDMKKDDAKDMKKDDAKDMKKE